MSKKILFVSHDASRTGAPIVLLNFLKWLKVNTDISFEIILKRGGILETEFQAIAPTSIFCSETNTKRNIMARILTRLGFYAKMREIYLRKIKKKLIDSNIGLIYANTSAVSQVLDYISNFLDCPVLCHIHELETGIRDYAGVKNFEIVKQYAQKYIAVSEAVQKNLIENHKISTNRVETIYEFIPTYPSKSKDSKDWQQAKNQISQQLEIPQDAKIVCASGLIEWRKGPDLFIQLARSIYKQNPKFSIYFLWLGSGRKGSNYEHLLHDIKILGLEDSVRFLGLKTNPLDYFAACDVFTLLSREDPFPLVVLEAASVGKPIVCFDNSGGAKEFIENDCGFVVPYLDIEAMAEKILILLNNPELSYNLGQRARQKVQERHDINVTAPKVVDLIEKMLC